MGTVRRFISHVAPGATATVTVTLPLSVNSYWKLQHNAWTQLTGATFSGNQVTLSLTDGDADGAANGTIIDPGAPAIAQVRVPITVTPTFTG